jgi:hypothetical protein
MTEPREVELWRATTALNAQCRSAVAVPLRFCAMSTPDRLNRQTDARETHAREFCVGISDRPQTLSRIVAPGPARRGVAPPQLRIGIQPDVGRFGE